MKRFLGLIAAASILLLLTGGVQAQNRNLGARTFTMDDGAGHTYTMQTPGSPGAMAGSVTYTLPLPPTGAGPAGYVNVGTVAGQTLFWNGTTLAWEASSVITNNTNGNGTGVSITAPLTGVLGSQFNGNGAGNSLTVSNAGAGDGLTVSNTGTGKALNATGPVAINGTLVTTGATTLTNLSTAGLVHNSAAGLLSTSAVNLASADVTGILPVANGGTGSAAQNFVDLTTAQTVAGNKTLTGSTVLGATDIEGTTTINTAGAGATSTTIGNGAPLSTVNINAGSIDLEDAVGQHIYLNHNPNTGTTLIGNPGPTGSQSVDIEARNSPASVSLNTGAGSSNTNIGTGGNTGMITIGNTGNALALTGGTNWSATAPGVITATSFVGPLTGHASSDLALAGGTMTGNIAMGAHSLSGLAAPAAANDATTKTYVDAGDATNAAAIAANTTSINNNTTAINNEVTRATTAEGTKLPLAGGTMTGAINMGATKITNLATPTAATDAATKGYVDAAASGGPGVAVAWGTVLANGTYARSYGVSGASATHSSTGSYSVTLSSSLQSGGANAIILASPSIQAGEHYDAGVQAGGPTSGTSIYFYTNRIFAGVNADEAFTFVVYDHP
jgi:hypothetical protein